MIYLYVVSFKEGSKRLLPLTDATGIFPRFAPIPNCVAFRALTGFGMSDKSTASIFALGFITYTCDQR